MSTQEPKVMPHLLSRDQVCHIQNKEAPSADLIKRFNEWIVMTSYIGQCSISRVKLQEALCCSTRELQSLLIQLQGGGWRIAMNKNETIDFY